LCGSFKNGSFSAIPDTEICFERHRNIAHLKIELWLLRISLHELDGSDLDLSVVVV